MNLRVKAIALSLAGMAILAGGTAVYADDQDDKRPIPGSTDYPKPRHPHPEENELHDRYGEDVGQVNLPPLAVKPPPTTGAAGTGKAEQVTPTSTDKLVDAGNANPGANVPVDPASIKPDKGTPADKFFNAASAGIGVMGIGVVALAVFAIRRSARLRKDAKADFLYQ